MKEANRKGGMERTRRHAFVYLFAGLTLLLLYTVLYQFGMVVFENVQRGYFESMKIVIESVTTTGYGEDAHLWESLPMMFLTMSMQLTGVLFLFLTLPLFLLPWIEQRLEEQLPRSYDGSDHLVICGQSEIGDSLIEELESRSEPYVVLHNDPDAVAGMINDGNSVVMGDPESTAALERVSISDARAVILDSADEVNATISLTVREVTDSPEIVAFVEEASLSPYVELAGADTVLQPRELLGQGLAREVSRVITTDLGQTVDISASLEVIELPISAGSDIVGERLETARLREETGVTIIGVWLDGNFVPNPDPDMKLDSQTVLLVSGSTSQLESAMERTLSTHHLDYRETVIAGYGNTGKAVNEALESSYISCQIIDDRDHEAVDVVGDATEPGVLEAANIETAGGLIVTVGDDTLATFITLVARDLNPDLEIFVRVNDANNRSKLYAAGADYVLPLMEVSARMLAGRLLGEEVISYGTQIDIVKFPAQAFAGQTIVEAEIRETTGCTVIAVERGEETITEIPPDLRLETEDTLIVAGSGRNIRAFESIARVE